MNLLGHWPVEAVREAAALYRIPEADAESIARSAVGTAVRALMEAGYVVVRADDHQGAVKRCRGAYFLLQRGKVDEARELLGEAVDFGGNLYATPGGQ